MASNGYLSWFWDGRAATGGWNASHMIVRCVTVRGRTVGCVVARRRFARPPAQRFSRRRRRRSRRGARIGIGGHVPAASRGGSVAPVRWRCCFLQVKGLKDDSLEQAFVREYGRMGQAALIAHEGRHAIDRRAVRGSTVGACHGTGGRGVIQAELEFNAKLSEIAFAPRSPTGLQRSWHMTLAMRRRMASQRSRPPRPIPWIGKHSGEIPGSIGRRPRSSSCRSCPRINPGGRSLAPRRWRGASERVRTHGGGGIESCSRAEPFGRYPDRADHAICMYTNHCR
jgi:hypothetical protein